MKLILTFKKRWQRARRWGWHGGWQLLDSGPRHFVRWHMLTLFSPLFIIECGICINEVTVRCRS